MSVQETELMRQERYWLDHKSRIDGAEILEEILMPARGYMAARRLEPGQFLRIIDLEGSQVADVMMFHADNLQDVMSCINTKMLNRTWKISKSHKIYTKKCTHLATIVEDTVGVHWFGGGFCSPETNRERYGIEGTVSCKHNLAASLAAFGILPDQIELDGCASIFMNIVESADGSFKIDYPCSKAGDYLDFEFHVPTLVAISNCPSERNPCNAYQPTPMKVLIYRRSS